jgi:hypothetical protein
MSLADKLKQAESNEMASVSGGWYKFKEGQNMFRLLTEPVAIYEDFKRGMCYENCGFKGSIKHLCYVLDRADNKIKLFKLPHTIFKWLVSLEADPDWIFDGFPMPYDVNIEAKGAGTKEVDYNPKARPVKEAVKDELLAELAKKDKVEIIIEKLKAKSKEKNQGATPVEYPTEEIMPEDIPF